MFKSLTKILFIFMISVSYSVAYAESVGTIIDVSGGAWSSRDGTKTLLRHKTPVFVTDIITTDYDGKVEILFNDDTSLAIGANSSIRIDDFVFDTGEKASFAVSAIKGVSRVITGKVVEQNREGFTVKTPLATVGIRGTIVTTDVGTKAGDPQIIMLNQIGEGRTLHIVGNDGDEVIMTRAGYSVRINPTGQISQPLPTQPQEQQKANKLLQGDGTNDEGDNSDDSQPTGDAGNTGDNFNDNEKIVTQTQDDSNGLSQRENEILPQDKIAHYQASDKLTGFNVNLNTASVTDAYFTHIEQGGIYQATGGTGSLSTSEIGTGTTANVSGFTSNSGNGMFADTSKASGDSMDIFFNDEDSAKVGYEFDYDGDRYGLGELEVGKVEDELVIPSVTPDRMVHLRSSNNAFGFTANVVLGIISDAYFTVAGTGANNSSMFQGYNGSGTLTGGRVSIDGFSYNGTGNFADVSKVDSATVFGTLYGSEEDCYATLGHLFYYDGAIGSSGSGTRLDDVDVGASAPDLDSFNVKYTAALTTSAGGAGNFGLTANLLNGAISNTYFAMAGGVALINGTGTLNGNNIELNNNSFSTIQDAYSGPLVDVYSLDSFTGTINNDILDITDFNILHKTGSSVASGTGSGGKHEAPANIVEYKYEGLDGDGDSQAIGFKLDLSTGVISDAYIAEENSTLNSVFVATGGSGIAYYDPNSPAINIFIDDFVSTSSAGLAVDQAYLDGTDASLLGVADTSTGTFDGITNGFALSNGQTLGGSTSSGSYGPPTDLSAFAGGDKILNYRSTIGFNMVGANTYNTSTTFTLNAFTAEISGATISMSSASADSVNFSGGTGTLALDSVSGSSKRDFTIGGFTSDVSGASVSQYEGYLDAGYPNGGEASITVEVGGSEYQGYTALTQQ